MKREPRVPKTNPMRSRIMSTIRSTGNTTTELRLIHIMRKEGITGWRRGVRLTGKPDFVFERQKLAVFVDGCFWHGCRCKRLPTEHRAFWRAKIEANRARDKQTNQRLRQAGWTTVRIWEHQLRRSPSRVVERLRRALNEDAVSPRGTRTIESARRRRKS
jgi:DNA mismatch endonuclease, patch repair protein